MNNKEALEILENMNEVEFNKFFMRLPTRVQCGVKWGLVDWHDVLPEYYIQQEEELKGARRFHGIRA